jgi:hypothetical protein
MESKYITVIKSLSLRCNVSMNLRRVMTGVVLSCSANLLLEIYWFENNSRSSTKSKYALRGQVVITRHA